MVFNIQGQKIETNEQGYLRNLGDWSEELASRIADQDRLKLYIDHWELIWYFRDYYQENQINPTMHKIVTILGKGKGLHFHDQKGYEQHIYSLFPTGPIHELCKLAGLPMPPPDT